MIKSIKPFADPDFIKVIDEIEALKESFSSMKLQGAQPEYIQAKKAQAVQALILRHEAERKEQLEALETEIHNYEKAYSEKMIFSKQAQEALKIHTGQYKAMSNEELQEVTEQYKRGAALDPHQLQSLSIVLSERQSTGHSDLRKRMAETGDNRPAEKLNPSLYQEQRELAALPFGHVRAVISGPQGQRTAQQHSVSDLFNDIFEEKM